MSGVRGYEATADGSDFDELWTEDIAKASGRITDLGLYPEVTASYIIFRVGSTYYRRDGETGIVDDSNADYITLLHGARDTLTSGGLIHNTKGIFECNNLANINLDDIIFEGEGSGTILRANATINELLAIYNSDNTVIRNLQLDGNSNAYTLLSIQATGGSTVENTTIENIWMHDNKTGTARSILWAWDQASGYNIQNLYLNHIYGWNMDTGASDYDNVAFTYVDNMTIENSVFDMERVLIFFYTKHAKAYNVKVTSSEYVTFVDDTNSDDTALINCHSIGQPTRLYGTNVVIRGGYYEDGLYFGDAAAGWYGGDILIDGAYITGAGPLALFGRRAEVINSRLLTASTHTIIAGENGATHCEYVLIKNNEISNGSLGGIYCILMADADTMIVEDNDLLGTGNGFQVNGAGYVRWRNNRVGATTTPMNITGTFTGDLDLPFIQQQLAYYLGGSAGWDVTVPCGIDLDADEEIAFCHMDLPPAVQGVKRVWVRGYSNVAEAANNMLLRLYITASLGSEAYNATTVNVINHPSEETGGIAVNDMVHWMFDEGDAAALANLATHQYLEVNVIGEAASAPDIATDGLFGVVRIEYI